LHFVGQITLLTDVVVFEVTLSLAIQPFINNCLSLLFFKLDRWAGLGLVWNNELRLLPLNRSFSFSYLLFGGQRNTFQAVTIFVVERTTSFQLLMSKFSLQCAYGQTAVIFAFSNISTLA